MSALHVLTRHNWIELDFFLLYGVFGFWKILRGGMDTAHQNSTPHEISAQTDKRYLSYGPLKFEKVGVFGLLPKPLILFKMTQIKDILLGWCISL